MTVKKLEKLVLDHLIESTGIKQKLHNVDQKINWVIGLIGLILVALITKALR